MKSPSGASQRAGCSSSECISLTLTVTHQMLHASFWSCYVSREKTQRRCSQIICSIFRISLGGKKPILITDVCFFLAKKNYQTFHFLFEVLDWDELQQQPPHHQPQSVQERLLVFWVFRTSGLYFAQPSYFVS